MGKLRGKVAVVTGGSSGIGRAAAHALYSEGAQVIITGRTVAALEETAQALGAGVVAIPADVTHINELEQVFASIQARFGGVDVLFVNVGIGKFSSLAGTSESFFDEVMDTNFKSAFFTIQKALPALHDHASIILSGSVNAHVGFPNASVFSASKAALHSLARTLSAELIAQGIRVNTLNTGPVDTPSYAKLGLPPHALHELAQTLQSKILMKRFGKPEEIARAVVFLASDDSSFVVGSELTIDGGLAINTLPSI